MLDTGCPSTVCGVMWLNSFIDSLLDNDRKLIKTLPTTAAESPWSNGLCEKHNAVIERNIHKVRLETGCCVEIALAWSLCAKNSLANVYGFSPNQLVFGKNPNLLNFLDNKLPANDPVITGKVLEEHLLTLRIAREQFVKAEACEKIKRALVKNVRTYSDNKKTQQ